ncbi:type VI secretion system protein TssL, short form [Rahnella perminowiae]|uniref:type VI secretion system protein TssL, short form n=1 Tax=Rahnella perminowiae TaxID=2816244 RepID=UPI001EE5F3FA|nr:type VI secretion system protein TssL, short form [Rahnella perminowiae]
MRLSKNGLDNIEPTAEGIDILMQDTWLLALAIRNGKPPVVDDGLYQHCLGMIQQVQDKLVSSSASDWLAEEIKFAHCVFVDEAIMSQPDTDVSTWWNRTPLQGHFLDHLHGGDLFYEHIKKLLREPAPSLVLVTCYYRMLLLGYRGKYRVEDHPERQALMNQLCECLPAPEGKINNSVFIRRSRPDIRFWRRSPWIMRGVALLLIAAVTCGASVHLHYLLGQWYTRG